MKKNLTFLIILILTIISAIFLIPSALLAENFTVPGTHVTVQAAIDAALLPVPGPISDTITIGSGTYNEQLVINIPAGKQVGYTLYLTGSGPGSTIIDANAVSRVITINGIGTVYISNMTITNGIGWGAGITNSDATLYLNNCIISDNNSGSHGGGLDNGMNGTTFISNCKIINNSAAISGGGIYNDSSGAVTIVNSSIVGNTAGVSGSVDAPKKVIAKYNWWGSSSGPSGGTADPDTGELANGSGDEINGFIYFDPWLISDPFASAGTTVEPVWVRTQEMACKRVWINEDNKFQLSFIYPYANNNLVKIYDINTKEVFIINMPYDNPNIIVDLPDGIYTVKTFHDQPEPLQTFIIGKP